MNLLQLCCRMMFGILKVMECESPCVNPLHNLESKTFYTLIALKIWRCLNFFFHDKAIFTSLSDRPVYTYI